MSGLHRHLRRLARELDKTHYVSTASWDWTVNYQCGAYASRASSISRYDFAAARELFEATRFVDEVLDFLDEEISQFRESTYEPHRKYVQGLRRAQAEADAFKAVLEQGGRRTVGQWFSELRDLVLVDFPKMVRTRGVSDRRARVEEVVAAELKGELVNPIAWRANPEAPGRTCQRLVNVAVSVLPAAHRLRYAEEFRSELWETRGRHRLVHAIRLAASAWSLRRNLVGSGATDAATMGERI
jgi:hypothetical protein